MALTKLEKRHRRKVELELTFCAEEIKEARRRLRMMAWRRHICRH